MKNIRFCQKMITFFEKKSKAILNLILALASNQSAHSPTELALNPLYKFKYGSISDAVDNFHNEALQPEVHQKNSIDFGESIKTDKEKSIISEEKTKTPEEKAIELEQLFIKETKLRGFLREFFPEKFKDKFWLLNTDVTSIYREHSPTLEDKEFVHAANTVIKDNKPITIGIRLSTIGLSARESDIGWNPPISILKVPFEQKSSEFAAKQIKVILDDKEVFGKDLVINGLDSAYCNIGYAHPTYEISNLVNIIRIAGNRNVSNCYAGDIKTGAGAKNKYGQLFKLPKQETHTPPKITEQFDWTMKNGRKCNVTIKQWNNLIIKGKRNHKMSDKPFNLISVQLTDSQTGKSIFKHTLWLTVWGQRRNEINVHEIYESYRNRFDIEFFFRFGKQKLLLDKFQTTDPTHLQNWFWIVMLADWLLYLNRKEGENIIRPWEIYNQKCKNKDVKELEKESVKTPTQTQRTMQIIYSEFAKENLIPKPHNNKSGRVKGEIQKPRKQYNVAKRGIKLQI